MLLFALSCESSHHTRPERVIREQVRTIQPLLLKSEKVDSCLSVLQAMDTAALKRPADKARWSLLYAMALDKNYIDTTDLSVLQPAIDRYTKWTHLNRLDKFYTWYYKGRIEENARIFDASLDSYLHAERYMKATDDVYRTRLYFGFERVYGRTMSRNLAYEAGENALKYARNSSDPFSYCVALTDCICNSSVTSRPDQTDKYIKEYNCNKHNFPIASRPYYLKSMVVNYSAKGNADSLKYYLDAYDTFANNEQELLLCAVAAIKIKDFNLANEYLVRYEKLVPNEEQRRFSFYGCRADVKKSNGDYSGALRDLETRGRLQSETYIYNLDRELSATEYRYHERLKRDYMLFCFISLLALISLAVVLYRIYYRKKSELLKAQANDYRLLYERILGLASGQQKCNNNSLEELGEAIESFGNNLRGAVVASLRGAIKNIVKIVGSKNAVDMVALFSAVHCNKMFIKLHDYHLTNFEIGYCFLLLLGLSSIELNELLSRKNLRNISLDIRKKLFITNKEQHLQCYLNKLFYSM